MVGEGVNGSPVVAPFDCPSGGRGAKVGVIPAAGLGYIFNADGDVLLRAGRPAATARSDTDVGNPGARRDASSPAVGLPAFGDLGGGATAFLAPAAGVDPRARPGGHTSTRAATDVVAAWDTTTGQFRAGLARAA